MIIQSTRAVLPEGVRRASTHVDNGVITRIEDRSATASAERHDVIDVGDLVISPGIVDTHVHDPERLQQRHKLTPYAGRTLRGMVRATYVRGRRVWDGAAITAEASGALL